ncbi:MAG: SIR2 family protein [Actinomycetota bacterium]
MSARVEHDPLQAATDLRDQLASDKRRVAFLFGAGTSMAVGMPGIQDLSDQVTAQLKGTVRDLYGRIEGEIKDTPHVEHVLNRVRLYRELLESGTGGPGNDLTFEEIRSLDAEICSAISRIVTCDPPQGRKPHVTFAQWVRALYADREYPIEIFTTNYDLLIEHALEAVRAPFFDGFVGSVAPFFCPESVGADSLPGDEPMRPPRSWTRLWKLHGSVNWKTTRDTLTGNSRISRQPGTGSDSGGELMIFPSRDKYSESRRLPFLTCQDRLRRLIASGETLLMVAGYSFSDEHINEILLQGLQSNSRLAVTTLAFGTPGGDGTKRAVDDRTVQLGQTHRNLTILGPDRACIGGVDGCWSVPKSTPRSESFWDASQSAFSLGDFTAFTEYLERFIGFSEVAESAATIPATDQHKTEDGVT